MIEFRNHPPLKPDKTRLILEAGGCDGDITYALAAVKAAAETGAWGFKVQMYQADELANPDAPRYDRLQGPATQWDQFRNALPYRLWPEVKQYCDEKDLLFFASCWDFEAVDVCESMGVQLYKVGSADITYKQLIQHIARTGKPILLSTGAATFAEVKQAYMWVAEINPTVPIVPFVCTLSYPCAPEDARLNRILSWRDKSLVGYSDHTMRVVAPIMASNLGACAVEKHFTITPGEGGDHDFAVTPKQAAYIVSHLNRPTNEMRAMLGDGDLEPTVAERDARLLARRSIHTRVPIPKGTAIRPDMLKVVRPGLGMPPAELDTVLGLKDGAAWRTQVDVPANVLLERRMVGHMGATLSVF